MASQGWVSLINNATVQGSGAGTSFTLATSGNACLSPMTGAGQGASGQDVAVIGAAGQPLGWYAGLNILVIARGFLTTAATTGTLTFQLRLNKTNNQAIGSQTSILAPVGLTTPATVITGIQWKIEALIRCTAVASSGNTIGAQGELSLGLIQQATPALPANPAALTGTPPGAFFAMPNASGETATAFDTTQLAGINLGCTSTAAQGTIQCTQWAVLALD